MFARKEREGDEETMLAANTQSKGERGRCTGAGIGRDRRLFFDDSPFVCLFVHFISLHFTRFLC